MRDEDRTMTNRTPADRHQTLRLFRRTRGRFSRAGCLHEYRRRSRDGKCSNDYRLRHPIANQEADPLRSSFSSVMPVAACPRHSAPTSWDWHRHGSAKDRRDCGRRAGRHAERTGCGGLIPGSPGAACGGRRALRAELRCVATIPTTPERSRPLG